MNLEFSITIHIENITYLSGTNWALSLKWHGRKLTIVVSICCFELTRKRARCDVLPCVPQSSGDCSEFKGVLPCPSFFKGSTLSIVHQSCKKKRWPGSKLRVVCNFNVLWASDRFLVTLVFLRQEATTLRFVCVNIASIPFKVAYIL